ncbi:MAG: NAD(P)/FAD-dependent oxidoreductase [Deltaproteobacteria bacterium]|nr:NAD(P)/FAD-dependent oxidoreductase [Deltaproteobacteria bacterium]
MTRYDAIIIGSGIGGLTAGLALAGKNRSVLLVEASLSYGGYLNPFSRKNFHFDPGLHYVGQAGEGQDFKTLLDQLDLKEITFNELSPQGFDWYAFPQYSIKFGRGIDNFKQQLLKDFPKEKRGINRFFGLMNKVDKIFKTIKTIKSPLQGIKMLPYVPLGLKYGRATLRDIFDDFTIRDPNLRGVLSGPCGDAGLPPSKLSGLGHLAILNHYKDGAFYPCGGTTHMMDVMLAKLNKKGATLINNTRVTRILHQSGIVTGVETETGEQFQSQTVISNAQGVDTYNMIGEPHIKKSLCTKVKSLENSLGSLVVFLGVADTVDTSRVGDNNVWHYASTDIDGMYQHLLDGGLPDGRGMFINIPNLKDPAGGRAPKGHHCIEIVTLCSGKPFRKWFDQKVMRRDEEYKALKEKISLKLIETAEQYLPGLSRAIMLKEVSTPATNFAYIHSPDGNIYGPAVTPGQVGPFRVSRRGPLKGLFLAGSSTDSPGIHPCAVSGKIAGSLASQYLDKIIK